MYACVMDRQGLSYVREPATLKTHLSMNQTAARWLRRLCAGSDLWA